MPTSFRWTKAHASTSGDAALVHLDQCRRDPGPCRPCGKAAGPAGPTWTGGCLAGRLAQLRCGQQGIQGVPGVPGSAGMRCSRGNGLVFCGHRRRCSNCGGSIRCDLYLDTFTGEVVPLGAPPAGVPVGESSLDLASSYQGAINVRLISPEAPTGGHPLP